MTPRNSPQTELAAIVAHNLALKKSTPSRAFDEKARRELSFMVRTTAYRNYIAKLRLKV